MGKPILLHCGDDIKWNHDLYTKLSDTFDIKRSHSMGREEFKQALKDKKFGDFVAIYRPFWNTGGEMSPWNSELMFVKFLRTLQSITHASQRPSPRILQDLRLSGRRL